LCFWIPLLSSSQKYHVLDVEPFVQNSLKNGLKFQVLNVFRSPRSFRDYCSFLIHTQLIELFETTPNVAEMSVVAWLCHARKIKKEGQNVRI